MQAYKAKNPDDQRAVDAVCLQNRLWHFFTAMNSPLANEAWDIMAKNLHRLPDSEWNKLERQHVKLHGYGIY
jgi:hypothetical protein